MSISERWFFIGFGFAGVAMLDLSCSFVLFVVGF